MGAPSDKINEQMSQAWGLTQHLLRIKSEDPSDFFLIIEEILSDYAVGGAVILGLLRLSRVTIDADAMVHNRSYDESLDSLMVALFGGIDAP